MFSPKPIASVEIFLDSVFAGKAVSKGGPLYTLPWNPHSFGSGLHMLRVKVKVKTFCNTLFSLKSVFSDHTKHSVLISCSSL